MLKGLKEHQKKKFLLVMQKGSYRLAMAKCKREGTTFSEMLRRQIDIWLNGQSDMKLKPEKVKKES